MSAYVNNSGHKDIIRSKWVSCIKSNYPTQIQDGSISILTLPAKECHDIDLFVSEGIIAWEQEETGAMNITKGKIICYEKSTPIFNEIRKKLTGNSIVNQGEIGKCFQKDYNRLIDGQASVFPVDVINLDFDHNISKNDTEIEQILDLIFQFQKKHKKNFSIFITFPKDNSETDEDEFKQKLIFIIKSNLDDPRNKAFKEKFENKYKTIESMSYESFLIVGINKLFIVKAVNHNYTLINQEYYLYGESGRHPMISLILNFSFNDTQNTPTLYYQDIIKCLDTINQIATPQKK